MNHSPVCQILWEILYKAFITESPPAWTSFDHVAGQFCTLFSTPLKNVFGLRLRQLPFLSCMVLAYLCFVLVGTFNNWYNLMLYLNKKKRPQKPCSSSEPLIWLDPDCIVNFACLLVFLPVANLSREAFRELQDRKKGPKTTPCSSRNTHNCFVLQDWLWSVQKTKWLLHWSTHQSSKLTSTKLL